ncbi:MAG: hypothetical protein IJ426_02750 [Clostridia bacterium]|nr:hypothetical protein [Clostridia bacterium]
MFIYMHRGDDLTVSEVSYGGKKFFEISIPPGLKPKRISRLIRQFPRDIPIASEGVLLPKALSHRMLDRRFFETRLMLNAFCDVITDRRDAVICDPDGRLKNAVLRPLTRVRTLYILTQNESLYAPFAERALREVGAVPIILKNEGVLSPAVALNLGERLPRAGVVLGRGGFVPTGNTVTVKNRSESRILAAAKYTVFMDKNAAAALPEKMKNGNLTLTLCELKKMLDTAPYIHL